MACRWTRSRDSTSTKQMGAKCSELLLMCLGPLVHRHPPRATEPHPPAHRRALAVLGTARAMPLLRDPKTPGACPTAEDVRAEGADCGPYKESPATHPPTSPAHRRAPRDPRRRTQPRRYAFDWNQSSSISSLDPERALCEYHDETLPADIYKEGRILLKCLRAPSSVPEQTKYHR